MSQQGHSTPPLSENAYTYNGKELAEAFGGKTKMRIKIFSFFLILQIKHLCFIKMKT
jgi:hypothetical protein